jgi:hypothetical protein
LRETVLYLLGAELGAGLGTGLGAEDNQYQPGLSPDRDTRSLHPNRRYGV